MKEDEITKEIHKKITKTMGDATISKDAKNEILLTNNDGLFVINVSPAAVQPRVDEG